jgi:hypothetical protein
MRNRLEAAKGNMERRQLNEIEERERQLQERMRELEAQQAEDTTFVEQARYQMVTLRKTQKTVRQQEREIETSIYQKERDSEIEKVVMKRLQMEKLKEQQELMENLVRKKESEV